MHIQYKNSFTVKSGNNHVKNFCINSFIEYPFSFILVVIGYFVQNIRHIKEEF